MFIILGNSLSPSFRTHFNDLARAHPGDYEILPVDMSPFNRDEPAITLFPGSTPAEKDANLEKLKGQPVTIFQSTTQSVGSNSMKILLLIQTLKRHGAGDITVALPYADYARQDHPEAPTLSSVAAEDFAVLLKAAGADKIITSELHSKMAEDYYRQHFGPENTCFLSTAPLFAAHLAAAGQLADDIRIGAPDGANKPDDRGQARARSLLTESKLPESSLFLIWKEHTGVHETRTIGFQGDVEDKTCIEIDDLSDSGGTLKNGAALLKQNGAREVWAYLSHPLLSLAALDKIMGATMQTESGEQFIIDRLVTTDSVADFNAIAAASSYNDRIEILETPHLYQKALESSAPAP